MSKTTWRIINFVVGCAFFGALYAVGGIWSGLIGLGLTLWCYTDSVIRRENGW